MRRSTKSAVTALIAAAVAVTGMQALGQEPRPNPEPKLRIETGMHTAMIRRIGVDRNCTIMATGSDDKTVRLWSLPDGQLLRTVRLPIGPGHEGKFFATTLSNDGRLIAAGGWDAQWNQKRSMAVYVVDAVTGRVLKRLTSLPSIVNDLAFSRDGRYLAAVMGGKKGVKVWEVDSWNVVGEDRDYQGDSYGAAFDNNGRLFTSSYDGNLRQYDQNFKLLRKIKIRNGKESFGIAVDPSGQNVAIGYYDRAGVDVYDTNTLSYKFSPDLEGIANGNLISVTWSADGERLIAGGSYYKNGTRRVLIWDNQGRGQLQNVKGPLTSVLDLAPCRDRIAIGGADPSIGMVTKTGKKVLWVDGVKADMRGKLGKHFTLSEDGLKVRFGIGYQSQKSVLFDLEKGELAESARRPSNLYESDSGSLEITQWKDNFSPKYKGKVLKLSNYEKSRAVAIRPDGDGFILGANWSLRRYDKSAKQLWKITPPSTVWGVNISGDGNLIVTSLGDGTIRWYRMTDGRELLALFVHAQDLRWVAWTPKGYFTASPGGEDFIGWHINRDWDQTADFFPGSRFRDKFYRPDIVKLVLKKFDENRAIREANRVAKRKDSEEDILQRLPPVINIIGPGNNSEFRQKQVDLEYSLRSPSGLEVTKVDVLLDGRPLPDVQLANLRVPARGQSGKLSIPLPDRDVQIALIARTSKAVSEPAKIALKWSGSPPKPKVPEFAKPKLYALLIGVSNYQDENFRLRYAAKDAIDVSQALKKQEGGVYREVVTKILTDQDATAGNIRDGLDWLEQEVTHRDVGLLFLAGHGITDLKQRFYYLPVDGNPEKLRRTAIPQSDIQDAISSLPGKVLMFIDACHSASGLRSSTQTRGLSLLDVTAVVNELSSAENGVVMFASSTGRQLSIEDDRWQNGAFTEALLEGLNGQADYSKDSVVSVGELDLWLSERVKVLTDKKQHPVARSPDTVPEFPFAIRR